MRDAGVVTSVQSNVYMAVFQRRVRGRRLGLCAFILESGFFPSVQSAGVASLRLLHQPLYSVQRAGVASVWLLNQPLWLGIFHSQGPLRRGSVARVLHQTLYSVQCAGVASVGPCVSHFLELRQAGISLHIMRSGSLLANCLIR